LIHFFHAMTPDSRQYLYLYSFTLHVSYLLSIRSPYHFSYLLAFEVRKFVQGQRGWWILCVAFWPTVCRAWQGSDVPFFTRRAKPGYSALEENVPYRRLTTKGKRRHGTGIQGDFSYPFLEMVDCKRTEMQQSSDEQLNTKTLRPGVWNETSTCQG